MPNQATPIPNNAPVRIEVFEYPAGPSVARLPAWEIWPGAPLTADTQQAKGSAGDALHAAEAMRAEGDRRVAEETRKSFEAGLERGRQEGHQAEREAHAAALKAGQEQRMRQGAELSASFAEERDKYMSAVEHEVVQLALAVAARILRREAQMDPLLLTGAVRVALGQLAGSTAVRLIVPAEELSLWIETIAALPNLALKPVVQAGEGMRLGDCLIETELGSVDLGIRAQLAEIERGFFDRAGGRRADFAVASQMPRNPENGGRP